MSTTVKQVYNSEVVQADWAVTDEGSLAFIKNKPTDLAKTDLSNIDNEVLKNKMEATGYSGGSKIQLIRWEVAD